MGYMTFAGFKAELSHTLGEKTQANPLLDSWINRAYFEVANMGSQAHLEICTHTVITDEGEKYTLPGDLMEIVSVASLTTKRRLIRTSVDDYHMKDRGVTGGPKYYVRRAGSIIFWPTPNREYEVELIYIQQPAPLVEPDDRTIIPNVFDHAITLLAARNAFLNLGDDEKATLRHQSAEAYIRRQQDEMDHSMGSMKEGFGVAHSFEDLTRMRNF